MMATWYVVGLPFGVCLMSAGPNPMEKRVTRM